jgi:hypothetical protein
MGAIKLDFKRICGDINLPRSLLYTATADNYFRRFALESQITARVKRIFLANLYSHPIETLERGLLRKKEY